MLINRWRLKPESVIVISISISFLVGLYFHLQYFFDQSRLVAPMDYYKDANYLTNSVIIKLKNSDLKEQVRRYVSSNDTIGFFSNSDIPINADIAYIAFQNLLAPTLLDRDNPEHYDYIIMFLKDGQPNLIASKFNKKIILDFKSKIYLAARK